MKKLALHWRILLGMLIGLTTGIIALQLNGKNFILDWVKPFGTIFINLLKLIAIPLVIASLIKGITDLKDISKLSALGGKIIGLYLVSTVIATSLGLLLVNILQPGNLINETTRQAFKEKYEKEIPPSSGDQAPLQALIDLVPENIFTAMSANENMLQVLFFVIFLSIGLILIPIEKSKPIISFFDGLNEVILKMVDLIMEIAPYGVFALLAALVVETPSADVFTALIGYGVTVLLGLIILIFGIYPLVLWCWKRQNYYAFFKSIAPAQLLAFSTSSSAAALPVTMDCVENNLSVKKEISSFVLPLGMTINMDGTSLYQAVAAVFIAQAFSVPLDLMTQLGIVMTATLASIGSAAVPGAGMIMLVIILGQAGIPEAGLSLILALDRPLDMCRTVTNVTSDATIAVLINGK